MKMLHKIFAIASILATATMLNSNVALSAPHHYYNVPRHRQQMAQHYYNRGVNHHAHHRHHHVHRPYVVYGASYYGYRPVYYNGYYSPYYNNSYGLYYGYGLYMQLRDGGYYGNVPYPYNRVYPDGPSLTNP